MGRQTKSLIFCLTKAKAPVWRRKGRRREEEEEEEEGEEGEEQRYVFFIFFYGIKCLLDV